MFLHLGGDFSIAVRDIISIHDYAGFSMAINQLFIKNLRQPGQVVDLSAGKPKSVVVTSRAVYLSAISSLTLKRRAEKSFPIDEKNDSDGGSVLHEDRE